MPVTTKKGDDGRTDLYWGPRVSKDNLRVEVFGALDELCSFLGLARSLLTATNDKKLLESIQRDLFVLGAEIATPARYIGRLKYRLGKEHIDRLEKMLEQMEGTRKFEECCFYLPGESMTSSALDIARTVTRRAERRVTTLKNKKMLNNNLVLIYLNRLSDLLYLMARSAEGKSRKLKYR